MARGGEFWTPFLPIPADGLPAFFRRDFTSRTIAFEAAKSPFPTGIIARPIFPGNDRLFPTGLGFATGV
jgi:hypothetical protein